jgi:glycosyltransferase involved in cell wall biosynthesis
MQIIFFTHPSFLGSQSMPRFAKMLSDGMRQYGHQVEVWSPEAKIYNLPIPKSLKKWAGYIDQYIMFPAQVKKKLKTTDDSTLFVFTDHALGPWVPLVTNRPHVIHCHDFLAQRSANGEITENLTGYSGKKYQAYIRQGYRKGKNFISVSEKTKEDLNRFIKATPLLSEVVYNGLNQNFKPLNVSECRTIISNGIGADLNTGYILHIGGNQWYKNRIGVIEIYDAWRKANNGNIPLIMLGATPNASLKERYHSSPYKNDIYLLTGKDDSFVQQAYSGAAVFLFPSLAEGFGWPIAEAMACGVPVITTDEAPMTEVGGQAAYYIARKQANAEGKEWAKFSAKTLQKVLSLTIADREKVIATGLENCKRFNLKESLNRIENIYKEVTLLNRSY